MESWTQVILILLICGWPGIGVTIVKLMLHFREQREARERRRYWEERNKEQEEYWEAIDNEEVAYGGSPEYSQKRRGQ
jgi:hypothetical protein